MSNLMYFLALLRRNFTNITSVILSAAILLVAVPAHADVHAGVEAYKKGDYTTALREFTELAEKGDPRAQYNLAVMYLKGHGVDKNLAKAFELQLSAADSGLAGAQHGLAIMYYRGEAVKRDVKKAAKWFRRAADLGFPKSQLNLAVMYSAGQGVKRNEAEVVKWTTLAASRGLPEALFRLGRMYEHGDIFIQSKKDAIYWYGQAGERGYKNGEVQAKRLTALLAPKSSVKAANTQDTPNTKSGSESKTRNWRAHLASFRTKRRANRAWDKLKKIYGEELADLKPEIVEVNLRPERGIYHRLMATPLANRVAAYAFCAKLVLKSNELASDKVKKQDCLPVPPGR